MARTSKTGSAYFSWTEGRAGFLLAALFDFLVTTEVFGSSNVPLNQPSKMAAECSPGRKPGDHDPLMIAALEEGDRFCRPYRGSFFS